jgi:fumarate reductase subunit C
MKTLVVAEVRKSRMPARLDFWQSATGLLLGLFMWAHLILVSSILVSKDAMMFVTWMMEGSLHPSSEGGYPAVVTGVALIVLLLFMAHAFLAMRKFPANWKQWRTMQSHVRMMHHGDTTQWWIQALTGFVMFFLASAHIVIMATNSDKIGPYLSADRFVSWGLWPLYFVLLFAVELHGAIGLYRLSVKWGWFDGKDPRRNRKRLKRVKLLMTLFFLTLGVLSFIAYVRIGLDRVEKGTVGVPFKTRVESPR